MELRETGRWRHYCTWDQLLEATREAAGTSGTWAQLAGFEQGEAVNAEFASAATPDDQFELEPLLKAG
jgi:hypothetical protein